MWIGMPLDTPKVGVRHGLVVAKGEHQRDVDVDALGGQRLNCRNALSRGRHFDHDVRAPDLTP